MAELIAKSALDGARLSRAGCTLAEVPVGPITSVAPDPGRGPAVAPAGHPRPRAVAQRENEIRKENTPGKKKREREGARALLRGSQKF